MQCVCGADAWQKFGFFGKDRIQRYRCKVCGKVSSAIPERPLSNLRVPLEQAVRVVSLLVEGVGIRAASRLTGLHQQTVLNILGVAGEKCEALLNERIRGVEAANVEVDELYSYVGVRPENAHPSDYGRGEVYCYLATA